MLAVAAGVMALVIVAHAALRRGLGRLARQAERDAQRVIGGLGVPLVTLIWLHGAFVAVHLLVPWLVAPEAESWWAVALRWSYGLTVTGALVWLLSRIGRAIEVFLRWHAGQTTAGWDDVLLPLVGATIRWSLPLLALVLAAPVLNLSPGLQALLSNATSLTLIGLVAFVLVRLVDLTAAFVLTQHRLDRPDNLQARAVHTQVLVLKRVAMTAVVVFTLASMLMVFESVRQFGTSILASAGIVSVIIGFAAQRSIATLLAGFQIAITQPIRVDDVVVVEGEWGRIEDISLTYVAVRLWDERRLVVPISYFLERPFQNWTRTSSEVIGAVSLHVDYGAPLDELRAELARVLAASGRWDGRVSGLQVTGATERTLEVRVLASAVDAPTAWDLRCEVREQLVGFLQRRHPDALPRVRATLGADPLAAAPTGPGPAPAAPA